MEVSVLGTKFNVNARTSTRHVSLLEGKVDVHSQNGGKVILHPGQTAHINSDIKVTEDDVPVITSWKDYVWTFENTPVALLMDRLRDDFGLVVKVKDQSIKERTISGNLSTKNLEVLYKALEVMLDIRIERDGSKEITLVQKYSHETAQSDYRHLVLHYRDPPWPTNRRTDGC